MSHTVQVAMIANQEIKVQGREVNVHDIDTIQVDSKGVIIDAYIQPEGEAYTGWLSEERSDNEHKHR